MTRRGGSKHWLHTTLATPELAFVANFSVLEDERERRHRLTTLVFDRGVCGHVRDFDPRACALSRIGSSARFGDNRFLETTDGFHLEVREPELELRADLDLRPLSPSSTLHNILGDGAFHWSVVPRLLATGTITRGERTYVVADAPAYRDRNWGTFSFGELVWDWGYVLPDEATCDVAVVFARLLDAARTCVRDQHVLVWEGPTLLGSFRGAHVEFAPSGRRVGPFATVPSALALCRPGHASDVPQRLVVTASSGRGEITIELDGEATARVLVPRDSGVGTTAIHESVGRARVTGELEGLRIGIRGHGFLETVHA